MKDEDCNSQGSGGETQNIERGCVHASREGIVLLELL